MTYQNFRHWLNSNWKKLLPLSLIPLFFIAFQFGNYGKFADPDGFYHAKASQLLLAGKLTDVFPWNYYTTWREGYASQHYLYHLLIAPFNTFPSMHWTIVIFGTALVLVFLWVLKRYSVQWKGLWAVLFLLGSADFLARINMIKANALSLILILLSVVVISKLGQSTDIKSKRRLSLSLALLSAVFVWTYGGFVVVPLIIIAYMVAQFMVDRKITLWPLVTSFLGIAIGVVLHPHNQNFITLIYDQLFQTGLGAGTSVPVGQEWSAYEIDWFFRSNTALIAIWLISIGVTVWQIWKQKMWHKDGIWLHGVSLGMLILTFWHRRFVEYWAPFVVLTVAVVLAPYLSQIKSWLTDQLIIKGSATLSWLITFSIIIFASLGYNAFQLQKTLAGSDRYDDFKNGALAIANDSPGGSIVINMQWDRMPPLFYWNDKDYYAVGLDPTFMFLDDAQLYWRWRDFADDGLDSLKDRLEVYRALKQTFRANYVWLELPKNSNLYAHMTANQEFYKELYRDDRSAVFKIQ